MLHVFICIPTFALKITQILGIFFTMHWSIWVINPRIQNVPNPPSVESSAPKQADELQLSLSENSSCTETQTSE